MRNDSDALNYQNEILKGVSRTFALTIPQLPLPLRRVVGNAYLLCRIADTIEDDPDLSVEIKKIFSQQFIQVLAGDYSAEQFAHALTPQLSAAILPAERDLIAHTATVVSLTHCFNARQQASLLRCVQIMTAGMSHFQQHCSRAGLADLPELDRYCYHVAGVVGEMLTELFCDYSPDIAANEKQLYLLSVSFGQGLQMTNILKDIWDDWQRGVCWLPRDIFLAHEFDLQQLNPEQYHDKFGSGLKELIAIATEHLKNALDYTLLIPKKEIGIRRFCLWALGMAILTLRKINQHPNFNCSQQVKISRNSVRATVMISNITAQHDLLLKLIFATLSRPLLIKTK
ncbi:phytoene/squalene synthase family protein [Thioflexithrix psekupsensis]|uniref:Phytoene synthase n=1 Tax=Thioflexithrix psekupsensis TaxID=1570016 RepID=A0A251X8M0_9GAMM|nr:phytoene/squalene synthase family protein [Thioflexithrix psekupsensis]OUD14023.1 phytoene synthase [Thioflexithrix psekupsensis]